MSTGSRQVYKLNMPLRKSTTSCNGGVSRLVHHHRGLRDGVGRKCTGVHRYEQTVLL